jgi:nucleotide-binding universal stress UspA family protein
MRGLFRGRDESDEPPGALAAPAAATGDPLRRIVLAFEPPGPPQSALEMATELGRRFDAELLLTCAIEWHPRYGGAEDAEAVRRSVRVAVDRLREAGIAASGTVAVALVGEAARVVAEDAVEFRADLMIVSAHRAPRLLKVVGLSFAQRVTRASRLPVLLLPADAAPPTSSRTRGGPRPRLRVLAGP